MLITSLPAATEARTGAGAGAGAGSALAVLGEAFGSAECKSLEALLTSFSPNCEDLGFSALGSVASGCGDWALVVAWIGPALSLILGPLSVVVGSLVVGEFEAFKGPGRGAGDRV